MTGSALSPNAEAALARVRVNIEAISAVVAVEPFRTPEQVQRANLLLRTVDTLGDALITAYDAEKRPHLDATQAIDRAFRGPKAEVKRVSGILREAITAHLVEQERARERALLEVQAAAARQDAAAANAAVLSIPIQPALEGTAERWTYEIEVIEDFRQVPIEYLQVDMARVRAEIAAANREGRPPVIPGIRFRKALGLAVGRL